MARPKNLRNHTVWEDAYLEALLADPQHLPRKALDASGWSLGQLTKARKKAGFAAKEVAILEGHPLSAATSEEYIYKVWLRSAKEKYLLSLEENLGASMQARLDARLTIKAYDAAVAEDKAFEQAEKDVYARLREKLVMEAMKLAGLRGKDGDAAVDPKCRDPKHLQWLLAKLSPEQWGEKAKEVNVRHSVDASVKSLDDQIAELLEMGEAEDAVLIESGS
jgi:hypothetical protein